MRIQRIDSLFMPVYFVQRLKSLYGTPYTAIERKRSVLLGTAAVIFDELFDQEVLASNQYYQLLSNPELFPASTFLTHIAKELQIALLQTVQSKPDFVENCFNVYQVQFESLLQKTKPQFETELKSITKRKGGISTIFCHQMINDPLSDPIKNILYQSGELGQLCDDIYDMYEDIHLGIHTWPIIVTDLGQIETYIYQKSKELNALVDDLPYQNKSKNEFKVLSHLLNAMSLYALQKLKTRFTVNKPIQIEEWQDIARNQLIIDIDHWKAYIQLFKLTVQLTHV